MKFEQYITFVFSTSHISQNDDRLLTDGETCVVAYAFEYGFHVYLSKDETEATLKAAGFSLGFIRIYFDSRDAGAGYMRLDSDGPYYEAYEKYYWE